MKFYFVLLIFGVFASSTSFVYIRESSEAPVMLAAYRLLLTSLLISPLFIRDYRRFHKGELGTLFRSSIGPGFVLGLHFITWVIGARMTTGANATLIVSLVPLAMPFFMLFLSLSKFGFAMHGHAIWISVSRSPSVACSLAFCSHKKLPSSRR